MFKDYVYPVIITVFSALLSLLITKKMKIPKISTATFLLLCAIVFLSFFSVWICFLGQGLAYEKALALNNNAQIQLLVNNARHNRYCVVLCFFALCFVFTIFNLVNIAKSLIGYEKNVA